MPTRIGITIPKKTGNSPTRNHWKRHIREGFRIHRCHIPNGFDIIVRPKKDVELNGKAIQDQLHKLIVRAIKRANRYDRNSANSESKAE